MTHSILNPLFFLIFFSGNFIKKVKVNDSNMEAQLLSGHGFE